MYEFRSENGYKRRSKSFKFFEESSTKKLLKISIDEEHIEKIKFGVLIELDVKKRFLWKHNIKAYMILQKKKIYSDYVLKFIRGVKMALEDKVDNLEKS